jgi:predicted nucleic acid-binding protein
MTDRTFVDTNVWVYAIDGADPDKQARAREIVAPDAGPGIVISTQVLTEFYVVATRKLAIPLTEAAAQSLVDQLAMLPVVPVDIGLVQGAIAGSREWGISLWDAMIVRAAEVAGCRRLLTEDLADGRTYAGVRVENPFAGPRT